ncbi:MAG: lipoprotein-releasing ABC transporter permease subunit [Hydrogenophilaceae bacterium]|nr:lipoprotein-releasing ABC transporter permease subunit [Hydrogenophilaceae bacterium]
MSEALTRDETLAAAPARRAKGAPPFGLFERALAARYLRAKRRHGGVAMISIISFLAIAAAVFVLIVTMSVMNGFRETLLSRILGVNGHVFVDTRGLPPETVNFIMREAAAIPGVANVSPIINEQALAVVDGASSGVYVRGIRRADLRRLRLISDTVYPASAFDNFAGVEAPDIIIGSRLADRLGVRQGMAISILAPQGSATPFGFAPRRKSFIVGGEFSAGMAEYDSIFIYMPLEQAQILFNRGAGVDQLELRLQVPDASMPIIMQLRERIGAQYAIYDWRADNESLVGALVVERNVMRLILMMIVAIAALNIVTGLIMLVKNKSRDIAILRTVGATRGAILRIFFMASASIGVMGLAVGLALGLLFCIYIGPIQDFIQTVTGFDIFPGSVYSLETLPARVEWSEVVLISMFTIIVTFASTLLTAWWGSRLDPVEALRYE